MADTSQSEADPPITNGVTTEDEDERLKQRPADIDAVNIFIIFFHINMHFRFI